MGKQGKEHDDTKQITMLIPCDCMDTAQEIATLRNLRITDVLREWVEIRANGSPLGDIPDGAKIEMKEMHALIMDQAAEIRALRNELKKNRL